MSIVTQQEILDQLGYDPTVITDSDLRLANGLQKRAQRAIKKFVGFEIEQTTFTEYYPDYAQRGPADMLVDGYELSAGRAVPYPRYFEDRRVLQLKNLPVRSLTSVYEYVGAWDTDANTPNFPVSSLLEPPDYMLDFIKANLSWTGFLYRRSGVWTNFERAVKVVYVAGLTADELDDDYADIKLACLVAIQAWFNAIIQQRVNQKSGAVGGAIIQERLGDWQVQYDMVSQRETAGLFNKLPKAAMKLLEPYVRVGQYI